MKLKYRLLIGIITISAVVLASPYISSNQNIVGLQPAVAQRITSSNAWQ